MLKKLLFIFLLTFTICKAQEKKRIFYGIISDDLGSLSRAHIINTNTQKTTYSNNKGEFKIFAQVNDSLKFTSVGYKTKVLKVGPKHFGIHENQIHLDKDIIELDEVEVKKHNLSGRISSDIKKVTYENQINAKTLGLPNAGSKKLTVAERRLYTAMGGMKPFQLGLSSAVSVDYIINTLSGRIKKLKTLKKIEDSEKKIKYLKNTFTNYIVNDLKIDSNNISRFIYFCQENPEYKQIQLKGEFSMILYLKEKSEEFKKMNKKE